MLEQAIRVIKEIDAGAIRPQAFDNVLSGYSGEKIIALLQSLTGLRDAASEAYVEIGVFQGLTLLANASANRAVTCFGIDNFSQFDPAGVNLSHVMDRKRRLNAKNANLIVGDFEAALSADVEASLAGKRIGVYFVDGPHDYRSQLLCLLLARPFLAPGSFIIVDDCNYRHVRQASVDFVSTNREYKLLFEAYTACHPENMNATQLADARRGWWDGVNVIVHDPEDRLLGLSGSTDASRELFYQDHIVHAQKGAEFAVEAISFAESFLQPWRLPRAGGRLLRTVLAKSMNMRGRYANLNTYSLDLPAARVAELKA